MTSARGWPLAPKAEFPPEQKRLLARARRLEWWSLSYTASTALLLYVTMGSSQAMRTSFFEDIISMVPVCAFLAASAIAMRSPSRRCPYGTHSVISIGYLTAALALVTMGSFLLIEAVIKIASGTRTTIGGVTLFGHTVWAGWPMLVALVYACVPSAILGHMKMKIAPRLHDKILFADAKMMKADWMTALATALGVIGIGLGFWWADPLAALLVSLDIVHDGVANVGRAVTDLIKERPKKTDGSGFEPLPEEVAEFLRSLDWVEDASVRLREDGHVFFGEGYVIPRTTDHITENIEKAVRDAKSLNWRMYDLVIMPVRRLPVTPGDNTTDQSP
jgi:divalent metal cation (Fe/Co/Zn/Cd) transporter